MYPEIAIENYVLDYFVILTLLFCHSERRVSGVKNLHRRPFGLKPSGWRKRRHSERSVSGVKNLILFRVSDRRIFTGDPSASPQGDKWEIRVTEEKIGWHSKRSFWVFYSVILTLSKAIAKNLILFHPRDFSIREFLRFGSGQRLGAGHPKKSLTFWGPRIKPLRMTGWAQDSSFLSANLKFISNLI